MASPNPFPTCTFIPSPDDFRAYRTVTGTDDFAILYGYAITRDGRVFSRKGSPHTPRQLHGSDNARGYKRVTLTLNGKKHTLYLHRLVAYAFHGPPPFRHAIVRHLDGNPANNHARNLAWGSARDNSLDAQRHGSIPHGEDIYTAKLTATDVQQIRRQLQRGKSLRQLAGEYDVSHTAIWHIRNNISWRHV
jgi:hypothetical protein